jgi:hypothetical protein
LGTLDSLERLNDLNNPVERSMKRFRLGRRRGKNDAYEFR